MARNMNSEKWTFMNYGYANENDQNNITLAEQEEINRYSIQLYHSLLQKVDFQSKSILEVGSGRGGGSHFIASHFQSMQVTGMDLAEEAVIFCNKNFKRDNLKYVEGNSEKMPVKNGTFDLVINVESSHAYGSVDNFLAEVKRVLKPNGYLLLTDFRDQKGFKLLTSQLDSCGLKLIDETDITNNVIKAIEQEDTIKRQRIQQFVPGWIKNIFVQFAGVSGSKIHTFLKNRDYVYYQYVYQKIN